MSTDAIPAGGAAESGAPTASPAVPAAAPAGQEPGVLTSMLTPVQPARPAAFSLDPQAPAADTPTTGTDTAAAGASSSSYHQDEAAGDPAKTAANSRVEKSVVRAWMLAAAARWAKGGGTQNKRLDLAKAKAQANQVKESRTVNIKRADTPAKPAPKNSPAPSPGGGKSLNKGNANGPVKDPKNTNRTPNTPAGRGNTGGAGSGGGNRGAGRDNGPGGRAGGADGPAVKQPTKTDQPSRTPKPAKPEAPTRPRAPKQEAPGTKTPTTPGKADSPKHSGNTGPSGAQKGSQGPAGSTGKPGKDTTPPKAPGPGAAGPSDSSSGKTPDTKAGPTGKVILDKVRPKRPDRAEKAPGGGPDAAKTTSAGDKTGKTTSAGEKTSSADSKPKTDSKPDRTAKTDPAAKTPQPEAAPGKPFSTRESREAGYRDGTRAARTVAHAKAYKDGVKDGYRDTTDAALREKARLDAAHAERKTERDKEQPVTAATSTDYHQPQPIPVQQVTSSHVILGPGAAKDSLTRGEVRCLKDFERRLNDRADAMTHVADATKNIKAHAEQQAKQATQLLEQAKGVKGGEKLIASLTKTADAATAQAALAEEIHKQALRAAENCRTVLANTQTRYGGIYQAVIDSGLLTPAEMTFYKG
jgi:hypothetical protein